ncbi:MAG: argininosuccinate synthase [Nitrospinae bacterium]|nr:argininosuccinate synthase [Nitrospinota bacterium]
MAKKIKKVVLAYSGGLDTSVIVRWLIEHYNCEVICFAADLGQGEELKPLHQKAKAAGASKLVIRDLKEEFARDFVFPMLRANAVYEGIYLLGTSIARPLIAKEQVAIAKEFGADAVSHGATGKGNDQVRFELTYGALNPSLACIAPWREWEFNSRESLLNYAAKWNIPVSVTKKKPWSMDRNLLHLSFEGGILEDPWATPPEEMFVLSVSPKKAPDKETVITVGYEKGNPVSLNGKPMTPAKLLARLNTLGGQNGIGRVDLVENRFVGMKSRGVYETPGGTILHVAHRAVESLTMDRETLKLRDGLIPQYAAMVYNGFWYSPEREALQTFMDKAQENVTGEVKLGLYKGNVRVMGRRSPNSLFDPAFATFEADTVYNQADAEGFIRLNALRLKIRALAKSKKR